LLLGGNDVHGHDRQGRAVHRHRDRHLVQRDAVEQDFHVLDAVDGYTRFAHIADDTRVVGVVAAVGGQVKSHRQAGLPGFEVPPVESIGFLGSGETCILAHGPRSAGIHGCLGAANKWRQAGQRVQVLEAMQIFRGIQGLDLDTLWRRGVQHIQWPALAFPFRELFPVTK